MTGDHKRLHPRRDTNMAETIFRGKILKPVTSRENTLYPRRRIDARFAKSVINWPIKRKYASFFRIKRPSIETTRIRSRLVKYQEKPLGAGYFMTNVRRLRVPCCCLYELCLPVFCPHLLQVRPDFQDRSYFSGSHWLFFPNTLWTSLSGYSMENTFGI